MKNQEPLPCAGCVTGPGNVFNRRAPQARLVRLLARWAAGVWRLPYTAEVGAEWQLYSLNVDTGAERMLAAVDLDPSAVFAYGFSLHPDGKRFLTSISKSPYDIWMIEGFPPPHARNWLDRFSDWLRGLGRPLPTRS